MSNIVKVNAIREMKVSELNKEIKDIKARTGTEFFKGSSKFLKSELQQVLIDWYSQEASLMNHNNEVVADTVEEPITIHNVIPTLKKLLDGGEKNSEQIRSLMSEIESQIGEAINTKNRGMISKWSKKLHIIRCMASKRLEALS